MEQIRNVENVATSSMKAQGNDMLKLKELYWSCISRWPWFVASVVLCLFIAWLYVAKQQPVYTRVAQVEIKDDRQGRSIRGTGSANSIQSLGILNATSTVANEKYMFSSPDLMYETVKRLSLRYNYFVKGNIRTKTLYGKNLPIVAKVINLKPEDNVSFVIESDEEGNIVLSEFKKNENIYFSFATVDVAFKMPRL